MDFGITIKPDLTIDRIVSLTRQAESAGFTYGWIFDSHVIWMEPFPLLTLMAANTKNMRLGTCVTNPAVRDVTVSGSLFATLNVFSHGRMQLGIGRGDSSRRVLGKKPTTLENLEEFVRVFRSLNASKSVDPMESVRAFLGPPAAFRLFGWPATAPKRCALPDASATVSSCNSLILTLSSGVWVSSAKARVKLAAIPAKSR
jgi:alkanesulfonate monooxygenase SsuD/methylene tetrahydromethanopterin reductase-like flavin-dependent oxidoreductase (luciferase family)